MPDKQISYINKDFNSFKADLIDFAKTYFPNSYSDFSDADPGTMFIELASYIGDVLSFYQDTQFQENIVLSAKEKENLMALAYDRGYRPKVTTAAIVDLDIFQLVPSVLSGGEYIPDFNYTITVGNNTVVTSQSTGQTFLTQDILDFAFSSSFNPTEVSVYQIDSNGNPVFYLLKKTVKAISGTIQTETFSFGTPERYPKITLNNDKIIEVIDITDSNGNLWYEVPYLAQETIFDEIRNNNPYDTKSSNQANVPYLLKLRKVPRRFVTRFRTDNLMEIKFGSGISANADEEIIPNPDNVGLGISDGISKLNMAFDPSNFLYTQTYGIAPYNTTLSVRYLTGGGVTSNVLSNDINQIDKTNISINSLILDQTTQQTVIDSLVVNNAVPAVGGRDGDSIDELRNNTLAAFSTQLRAVTKEDYAIRALLLPSRYGSVAKVFVSQDSQLSNSSVNDNLIDNNPLALSLYVLSYDGNKNLTQSSLAVKTNLKTYLNQFKMLNDSLNLKDSSVINIGVNFDIITTPGFNNKEVILNAISSLKDYFNIDKWSINQPIIISEIYNLLSQIKGVQSINKVEIVNKQGGSYSQWGYDIKSATKNGIIYPSLDYSIFEIKFPSQDIMGRVITF